MEHKDILTSLKNTKSGLETGPWYLLCDQDSKASSNLYDHILVLMKAYIMQAVTEGMGKFAVKILEPSFGHLIEVRKRNQIDGPHRLQKQ